MQLQLEIKDEKADIFLYFLEKFKDDIVNKVNIIDENIEEKTLLSLSNNSLDKIWDNKEDSIYDKYLSV